MKYHVTLAGRTFEVELGAEGASVDGVPLDADLAHAEGTGVRSLLVGAVSHRLVARRAGRGRWHLDMAARRYTATVVDERTHAIQAMTGTGAGPAGPVPVRAPMPGLVLKVEVEEGERVETGRGVVIVEAMKMENELRAEGPGVVRRVAVSPGDAVEKDQLLVEFDPVDDSEAQDG